MMPLSAPPYAIVRRRGPDPCGPHADPAAPLERHRREGPPAWQVAARPGMAGEGDYDSREVRAREARAGLNAGVRMPPSWVARRRSPQLPEGRDPLAELVRDVRAPDLSQAPHVRTGSGGHHYYFQKPADVQLLDSPRDYPGLEFKSHGRQVVAPGSIHRAAGPTRGTTSRRPRRGAPDAGQAAGDG